MCQIIGGVTWRLETAPTRISTFSLRSLTPIWRTCRIFWLISKFRTLCYMYFHIHLYIFLVMPSLKKPIEWWRTRPKPLNLLQMQSDLNCIPKWFSSRDRRRGYTVMFIIHGRRQKMARGILLRPMYLFLPLPLLPLPPSSAVALHLQWFHPTITRRLRSTYRVGKSNLT